MLICPNSESEGKGGQDFHGVEYNILCYSKQSFIPSGEKVNEIEEIERLLCVNISTEIKIYFQVTNYTCFMLRSMFLDNCSITYKMNLFIN